MTALILGSSNPLDHVVQHNYIGPGGPWYTFSTFFSNHIAMQILAALLLIWLIPRFARLRDTGNAVEDLTPRGAGNFFESICNYLRNEVARPAMGEHTDRFIAYIWSAFFYVLFCNLLGLLPLESITRPLTESRSGRTQRWGGASGSLVAVRRASILRPSGASRLTTVGAESRTNAVSLPDASVTPIGCGR